MKKIFLFFFLSIHFLSFSQDIQNKTSDEQAKKTKLNVIRQACINGGFENGANFWNFSQHEYPAGGLYSNPSFTNTCDMTINTIIPVFPDILFPNLTNAPVSFVTSGNDPTLSTLGVSLDRTNTGSVAIRLNEIDNASGTDITSVFRTFSSINEPSININFALVFDYIDDMGSHDGQQPFIEFKVLDQDGNVYYQSCIVSDPTDCRFTVIPDVGHVSTLYTDWLCASINVAPLIGQSATLQISVADCGGGNHRGYAYIDDVCNGPACVDSSLGGVQLDPLNLNCPDEPYEVCGTLTTPNNGTLSDIALTMYDDQENEIATYTELSDSSTSSRFCFELDPADIPDCVFGLNFSVSADYQITCGTTMTTITVQDFDANPGPDVDLSTCVKSDGWPIILESDVNYFSFSETDTNGDIIIGLYAQNAPDFIEATINGSIIAKYAPNGCQLWSKELPYAMDIVEMKIASDNAIYILGNSTTSGEGILLKYDSDGNRIIEETYTISDGILDFDIHPTSGIPYVLTKNKVGNLQVRNFDDIIIFSSISTNNNILSINNSSFVFSAKEINKLSNYDERIDMQISNVGLSTHLYLAGNRVSNLSTINFGDGISLAPTSTQNVFVVDYTFSMFGSLTAQAINATNVSPLPTASTVRSINIAHSSIDNILYLSYNFNLITLETTSLNILNSYNIAPLTGYSGFYKTYFDQNKNRYYITAINHGKIYFSEGGIPLTLHNYESTYSGQNYASGINISPNDVCVSPDGNVIYTITPDHETLSGGYLLNRINADTGNAFRAITNQSGTHFKMTSEIRTSSLHNELEIVLKGVLQEQIIKEIFIYDIGGNLKHNEQFFKKLNNVKVNCTDFKEGIYFIKIITSDNDVLFNKFIIKN